MQNENNTVAQSGLPEVIENPADVFTGGLKPLPVASPPNIFEQGKQLLGGITELLPITPTGATISPKSGLSPENAGKSPGVLNKSGQWTGFIGWSDHQASEQDLLKWASSGVVSVGINCRKHPCVDNDIDDPVLSAQVSNIITQSYPTATRIRDNSPRKSFFFTLAPDEISRSKRRIILKDNLGQIEFLGFGSQSVLYGPHQSGAMQTLTGTMSVITASQLDILIEILLIALGDKVLKTEGMDSQTYTGKRRGGEVVYVANTQDIKDAHQYIANQPGADEGERDKTCYKLATYIREYFGVNADDNEEAMQNWSLTCDPEFPPKEVKAKVQSVYSLGGAQKAQGEHHPNYMIKDANFGTHPVPDCVSSVPLLPKNAVVSEDGQIDFTNVPILKVQHLEEFFKGVIYVSTFNEYFVPGYSQLVKAPALNGIYGGHIFDMDAWSGAKTTRIPVKAIHENTVYKIPQVKESVFDPDYQYGEIVDDAVNICKLPEIKTNNGDVTLFLNHLSKLLPDEHDQMIILSYMASIIQNPGKKIRWCPILIGVPGNGKSTISAIIVLILGSALCHEVKVNDLGKNGSKVFNKWMMRKVFATLEEINTGDRLEVQQALLTWITNRNINVEGKGIDDITIKNVVNLIGFSNSETPVCIDENDRRYTPMHTAQEKREHLLRDGLSEDYFVKLYQWIESDKGIQAIAGYLMRYPISISLNSPPLSTTHYRVVESSKPQWQLDIESAITGGEAGARGGFIIPRLVAENVPKKGIDNFMTKLSYIKCNSGVRVNNKQFRVYAHNIDMIELSGADLRKKLIHCVNMGSVNGW